jgi:general secretion pathway protein A
MDGPPFGSRKRPFADTVDPDFFYRSPLHESACAELFAAAKTHAGLLVLSGEAGTGKTTVLRRVARDLERAGGRVLSYSPAGPLHEMVPPLGEEPGASDAATPTTGRKALLATLQACVRSEGATVVAVDEAQGLEPAELGALRDLAEAGGASGMPLAVLLVGQPGLDVKLARLAGDGAGGAFALRVLLSRLETSEVRAYVAYRLEKMGSRLDDVFQAEAVERVAAYAEGIPQVINHLCNAALRAANQAGLATVSASSVDTAARWLDLAPPIRSAARGAGRLTHREVRPRDAGRAGRAWDQLRAWTASVGARDRAGRAWDQLRAWTASVGARDRAGRAWDQLRAWTASVGARDRAGRAWDQLRAWTASVGALVLVGGLLYALQQESEPPLPRVPAPTEVKAAPRPRDPLESHAPQSAQPAQPPTPGAVERPPNVGRTPEVAQLAQPATPGAVERHPGMGRRPARERLAPAGRGNGTESGPVVKTPTPATPRAISRTSRALLDAAEAGNLTEARALLAGGAPPEARDAAGMTPLMSAVIHGHGAVAGLLLERGADVNARDDSGVTALMLAANNNRTALLQTLLGRGANVNARTRTGWTALTYAAWKGHVGVARRLLAAGADPSLTDRIGWTPLQYATWRAEAVTRAGLPDAANPSVVDDPELAAAAQFRYIEMVGLLGRVSPRR